MASAACSIGGRLNKGSVLAGARIARAVLARTFYYCFCIASVAVSRLSCTPGCKLPDMMLCCP